MRAELAGAMALAMIVAAGSGAVAQTAPPAAGAAPVTSPERPAAWAKPVAVAGAPNLHRVTGTLYRSAQPDAKGFASLAGQQGVRTVVSLRARHSDAPLTSGLGLDLVRIPINTWNIKHNDVVRALRSVRQAQAKGPVLLHCQHGADRTGMITALYRVLYEGWSKDAALEEMQKGQFGYHTVWGNIPAFIRNVDIERLRGQVEAP